jgi:hypothetical protein
MRAVMGLVAREVEVRSKEPFSTFSSGLFKSLLFSILKSPNSSPELFQVLFSFPANSYCTRVALTNSLKSSTGFT